MMIGPKLLITGAPGIGKTTLIRKVVGHLDWPVSGFYTQEIRERGSRVGFSLNLLSGPVLTLSHVSIRSPHRVGKYGVDVAGFEAAACPEIEAGLSQGALIVIDEIGKMELFSEKFRRTVLRVLKSPCPLLAAILQKSHPFTDPLKARLDVEVIEVTAANRERLVDVVLEKLGQ